ncbi:MAG: glutamine-hydrolyzing carbamoyl-phosphate synthase small subunit [Actinobacteria bacterium]|nr:glutamine-hydrolyzing carbamoyl-phosphate synthase small subunit [Actinomycetota bacterium]
MRGRKPAVLVLDDGTVFEGTSMGARGEFLGEACFNTSMAGYQEILTDPSYAGQMVSMTYPLIGNYGVNPDDVESGKIYMGGFIVRESSRIRSNWRSTGDLDGYLKEQGVVGLEGIDTRALTKHLRSYGARQAALSSVELDPGKLLKKVEEAPGLVGADLVLGVTIEEPYVWSEGLTGEPEYEVVAYDFGIKRNILRLLTSQGCRVTVVPAATTAVEILERDPDGVFLSNGPGDPEPITYAIESIRGLLGKKPVFGICLGHQLLGLALGGRTYKLKFGHRGGNQPVMNRDTGRVEITAQNHGFAVEPESLKDCRYGEVELTHWNLNDDTLEGMRCREVGAFSVQYHPEASPGPHDSRYLFEQFLGLMKEWRS